MAYISLGLMAAMIIDSTKHGKVEGFDMAIPSLAGIIGFYFGSTAWQNVKR